MKVIDFTTGNRWGRAIHGNTFMPAKAPTFWEWLRDKVQKARRASVLIHYPEWPEVGDRIVWETEHHYVRAEVVAVKPFHDPGDMYNITVRIRPSQRIKK